MHVLNYFICSNAIKRDKFCHTINQSIKVSNVHNLLSTALEKDCCNRKQGTTKNMLITDYILELNV